MLAGRTLVLWNDGGHLRLHVDDARFLLTDDITVHHERGNPACFVVSRDGEELLRWEYKSPSWGWALIDPTFDDDQFEDFDFGEYIANVTAEVERRPRVHNLAWFPANFEHPFTLVPEVWGILEEHRSEEAEALMQEVRRWCWRWDEPEGHWAQTFCSWCDAEKEEKVPLRPFGPGDEPRFILCGACIARSLEMFREEDPDRRSADVLRQVSATLRESGFEHAEVIIGRLELCHRDASPPILPAGTACGGCEALDQPLARGPGGGLCAQCLSFGS